MEGAGESGSFPENEVQTLFSNIYKSEISPHDKCFSTHMTTDISDKYQVCHRTYQKWSEILCIFGTTYRPGPGDDNDDINKDDEYDKDDNG